MKTCFKCSIKKPLSEFYRHARMADGHLNKCKACAQSDAAAHRLQNIDAIRAYDRERGALPHRREKSRVVGARWRSSHADRRAAQVALGNAVRDGKVIPWPACAIPECDDKPEAHHPDYSEPLSVVWLCSCHHKQAHAIARTMTRSRDSRGRNAPG